MKTSTSLDSSEVRDVITSSQRVLAKSNGWCPSTFDLSENEKFLQSQLQEALKKNELLVEENESLKKQVALLQREKSEIQSLLLTLHKDKLTNQPKQKSNLKNFQAKKGLNQSHLVPAKELEFCPKFSSIFRKPVESLSIHIDLPRLVRNFSIDREKLVGDGTQQVRIGKLCRDVLVSLAMKLDTEETLQKIEEWGLGFESSSEEDESKVPSVLFQLFQQPFFANSRSLRVLKACTQSFLAPAITLLKAYLEAASLSFNSSKNSWRMAITTRRPDVIVVQHFKTEVASPESEELFGPFSFEWTAIFTFDKSAERLVDVEIVLLSVQVKECPTSESLFGSVLEEAFTGVLVELMTNSSGRLSASSPAGTFPPVSSSHLLSATVSGPSSASASSLPSKPGSAAFAKSVESRVRKLKSKREKYEKMAKKAAKKRAVHSSTPATDTSTFHLQNSPSNQVSWSASLMLTDDEAELRERGNKDRRSKNKEKSKNKNKDKSKDMIFDKDKKLDTDSSSAGNSPSVSSSSSSPFGIVKSSPLPVLVASGGSPGNSKSWPSPVASTIILSNEAFTTPSLPSHTSSTSPLPSPLPSPSPVVSHTPLSSRLPSPLPSPSPSPSVSSKYLSSIAGSISPAQISGDTLLNRFDYIASIPQSPSSSSKSPPPSPSRLPRGVSKSQMSVPMKTKSNPRRRSHELPFANSIKSPQDDTKLLEAVVRNASVEECKELIEKGASLQATNHYGQTALHLAAAKNLQLCQLFLSHNADPNKTDLNSWTPLHIAAENGQIKIIDALLQHGAQTTKETDQGTLAVHYFVRYDCQEAELAEGSRVLELLCRDVDVNHQNLKGETCLHYSCLSNCPVFVQLLLELGASCNIQNKRGRSPFHLAIMTNKVEFVKIMLNFGAIVDSTTTRFLQVLPRKDSPIYELLGSYLSTQLPHIDPNLFDLTTIIEES